MKVRKAVIPAAGVGTRFLPATKVVPKELLPIVDRPAIEIVVQELAESSISEIILVISKGKESVLAHFSVDQALDSFLKAKKRGDAMNRLDGLLRRVKFTSAYQDEPKGLGHAVGCAREKVGDEPFAVVLPDDLVRASRPCLRQALDIWEREQISVVAVEEVPETDVGMYGIVGGGKPESLEPFRVTSVIEKPSLAEAPSRWAIIGRYVLRPEIFDLLDKAKPGAIGEIQLTDGLAGLAGGKGLLAFPFEGLRIDVGQPPGFLRANMIYGMDHPSVADSLAATFQELKRK